MHRADRVRANTSTEINERLDAELEDRVREYATRDRDEISCRIHELDQEWDVERVLETNASLVAFAGLLLGVTHCKKWLMLPAIVLPFLFQHATQGWCPPLPILRRLGVRTQKEIDREICALKLLRGDFDEVQALTRPEAALQSTECG